MMGEGYLSLTGAVLTVICVLILAYWCSRVLGKKWVKTSSGKHMKVLEQLQVGADRQLLLLKLQDHIYLLGASQAGIQMLAQVEGELHDEEEPQRGAGGSGFRDLLKTYGSMYQKKKGGDK